MATDVTAKQVDEAKVAAVIEEVEGRLDDNQQVARAQQDIEHKLTKMEAIKAYPRACIYLSILLWALVTAGYEYQASGMVLGIPVFRRDFGYTIVADGVEEYTLEASWQSAITGGATVAMVLSSFVSTSIVDYTGRKWLFIGAVVGTIAFVGIEFAATSIQVFFVGKFLNALCLGIIQTIGVPYIAELTPLALRGMSTTGVNLASCFGPLIGAIVGYATCTREDRWAYRGVFCSQWFFGVTAAIMLLIIPESPYHHVLKGNDEKALKALKKIYPDGSAESQLAVIRVTVDEANELSDSGSWKEIFDKKNIKRTLIAISPFLMQPLSGLPYVSSYQTYYYEISGFDTFHSFRIAVGAQALSVGGTLASLFMVDSLGRRFVVLYAISSLAILNLLIAALGLNTDSKPLVTASCGFLTMFNFFFNSGIGPIAYVINAELPTSRLRAKTVALGIASSSALNCMWSFVLPYMFNADEANMGSAINFIFSGFCFISLLFFFFFIPETSGRSYEEIDEMFVAKVPYRKWPSYTTTISVEAERVVKDQEKELVEHVEEVVKEKISLKGEEVMV